MLELAQENVKRHPKLYPHQGKNKQGQIPPIFFLEWAENQSTYRSYLKTLIQTVEHEEQQDERKNEEVNGNEEQEVNERENDNEMAAQAEQLHTQYTTSIISKEFNGTAKFKGPRVRSKTIVRLHKNAKTAEYRVAMEDEMNWELLSATLKDPATPPVNGIDGRKFVAS